MYIVFRFHGHHMACMFLCQEVTKRYEHKKKKKHKKTTTLSPVQEMILNCFRLSMYVVNRVLFFEKN